MQQSVLSSDTSQEEPADCTLTGGIIDKITFQSALQCILKERIVGVTPRAPDR